MITYEIDNIIKDPSVAKLRDKWDYLINIEADLNVYLNGSLYFSEPMMTIVELAVELKKWLSKPIGTTFKYETIDDDETEIFNIIAVSSDTYKFQSVWQKAECVSTFTRAEVIEFINNYIHQVKVDVQTNFGVNLHEKIGL